MRLKIAILAGDGIGPEVTNEAVNILKAVAEFGGHDFTFVPLLVGGVAITATGSPLPTPLVEGTPRPTTVRASRVASPRALKAASATWCRLTPRIRSTWTLIPADWARPCTNSWRRVTSKSLIRPLRAPIAHSRRGRLEKSRAQRTRD